MKRIFLVLLAALLAGCSSVEVSRYQAEKPELNLRTYFNGTIEGWGMFQKSSGEVVKRFYVTIVARWEGATGTLDEDFTWSDGTRSKRIWTLTDLGGGKFSGRADDVVGEAIGEASGNALRWRYVLALPVDGTIYHVNFDDWMVLIDDQIMINRAAMSKFGIPLGEVTLSFRKVR